ncbi:MAG: NAD(P)H-hydrate dehydratase [Actinomycetota bacterium]|nr:NAD(P)H-hydrate dehydratase [Actinomycetota bacterium]
MIPVVTPDEMKSIDEESREPTEVLVQRAGAAVARRALQMLGGGYGRRVVVVAGKGNNGADGRVAGQRLRRSGARVTVVEATDQPQRLPPCDLLIDAAFGTGFRGEYQAPAPGGAPVLAVDIPSGVDGLTGQAGDGAVWATTTVTFAALKPGLLLGSGPERTGPVELVDIGLDASRAHIHLVQDEDVGAHLPPRPRESHKWRSAVFVAAGSPGMMGAPLLVARAALRAGAGYVNLGVPGAALEQMPSGSEAVARALPSEGWAPEALRDSERFKAAAVGPGLGRGEGTLAEVRRLLAESPVPLVVDGDALAAVDGPLGAEAVLTPHAAEYERLAGSPLGPDRLDAARSLAARLQAVVLLKGPTTVVAHPQGEVLISVTGDTRLATAGTGDVLSGVIAAFLAQGVAPMWAAGLAAHVHGSAARLGPRRGMVAGDVVELLPQWLSAHA